MSRLPNPDLLLEKQEPEILLAMCLWGEARGQSVVGVAAVACTILNRMKRRDTDVAKVVLKPWQFSSFNKDDPNRAKLAFPLVHDTVHAWEKCYVIATLALQGALNDITLGSTHYYADSMPEPPYWADEKKGWKQTAKIGGHTFGTAP